jgi:hypothetical protein
MWHDDWHDQQHDACLSARSWGSLDKSSFVPFWDECPLIALLPF